MKEYILLSIIAAIGMIGLLNIHHEVKAIQQTKSYISAETYARPLVKNEQNIHRESQLSIDSESAWPDIVVEVNHFNQDAIYYLDLGNGERRIIKEPKQLIHYDISGKKLIKLLRENILVDAVELNIELEETYDRLASY